MADNSSEYSRIYNFQSAGVDKLLSDISKIEQAFVRTAQAKSQLAANGKVGFVDPGVLDATNDRLEAMLKTQEQALDQLKEMTAVSRETSAATKELSTTMAKVTTVSQGFTTGMQEASAAMGENMLEATAGFAKFQAVMQSGKAGVTDYNLAISALGGKLAELKLRLEESNGEWGRMNEKVANGTFTEEQFNEQAAILVTEQSQLKTAITETTAAMTALNKTYNPTLLADESAELAANKVELLERNRLLKLQAQAEAAVEGSIKAARAEAALMREELNNTNLTTEEGAARAAELRIEIEKLDAFIKENVDLYTKQKINIGNYPELTIEVQQLKEKMDELRASGMEDSEMFQKLGIEANKLAARMQAAKSTISSTGAGMTLTFAGGDGFSTSQKLNQTKQAMQDLAAAGQKDTAEFRALEAEAQRLTAAMAEVNTSIKGATTTMDKFGNIVEKMGLRMIANLLIFQAVIELVQEVTTLYQNFERNANVADTVREEMAKNMANNFSEEAATVGALKAEFESLTATEYDRQQVVDELNSKYEKQIGHLNGINDAEKFFRDKSAAFIEALNLRAKAAAALNLVVKEYQTQMEQLANPEKNLDWIDNMKAGIRTGIAALGNMQSGQSTDIFGEYNWQRTTKAIGEASDELSASYKRQSEYQKLLQEATEQANAIDKKNGFKTNADEGKEKVKKEHDYLDARMEAEKKYNDFMAKTLEARIKMEADANEHIMSDSNKSLSERLNAYQIYIGDQKRLLDIEKANQIQDVQDKLKKIEEITKKPASQRTTEENTLLINKDALNAQLDYINAEFEGKMSALNAGIQKGLESIVSSSFEEQMKLTDQELTKRMTDIQNEINRKKSAIYGSDMRPGTKDASLGRIDEASAVEKDQAALEDTNQKIWDTETAMQLAHHNGMLDLEKQYYSKLLLLKEQYSVQKGKKDADQNKIDLQKEAYQQQKEQVLEQAAFTFAKDISGALVQLWEKEDQMKEALAQRQLDWTLKVANATSQSKQQQYAQEKANYIAEQQLAKQKMIDDKKRAEAQAALDYGIAATQMLVNVLESPAAKLPPDFGLSLAMIEEGALAATFAAKEAIIASAPTYATGVGSHPGGFAVVGDGGEPELIKIGNQYLISPSTDTLMNLPKGASVTPFSQMTIGSSLNAPKFSNSSSGKVDFSEMKSMMAALMSMHGQVLEKVGTIQVSLDTHKLGKKLQTNSFKKVVL